MTGLPRGYDEWKTRSPGDQYAIDHPEKYRRGVYTAKVTRTITATIEVRLESGSEEDATWDAAIAAKAIPLDKWEIDQDDYETTEIEGPPERDLEYDR